MGVADEKFVINASSENSVSHNVVCWMFGEKRPEFRES